MQALADDTRVHIVRLLVAGPRCVTDIAEAVGADVGRTSYHLGILRNAGVLEEDRQGQFIYYALSDEVRGAVGEDGASLELGCFTLRFEEGPEPPGSGTKTE
jgi:ArsR family transcriptional regulator, arsenate/arsenite/antimonite-responsive transcriptional repressor